MFLTSKQLGSQGIWDNSIETQDNSIMYLCPPLVS